jgi:acetyl esterase/lipase
MSSGVQAQEVELWEISNLPYSHLQIDTNQTLNLVGQKGLKFSPLLVWIGGGAWSHVNKNVEMDLARQLAKQGIIVASVGHRLSSEIWRDTTQKEGVQFPAHIEDIADAIQWLFANSEAYGIDKSKIVVGGFSSGAHLAALVAMDRNYLDVRNLPKDLIKGILTFSGTYDIKDYYDTFVNGPRKELATLHVEAVFGSDHSKFGAASPTTYIDQLETPLLIVSDHSLYRYTRLFEEKLLEKAKDQLEVIYVHKMNHGELWRSLAKDHSIYRNVMIQFINDCTS